MAGFRNTILHGFATLGHAVEQLNKARFSGDPTRLHTIDVRFTQPVVLPGQLDVFTVDGEGDAQLFVGRAPGGPAFLTGTFSEHAHG